MYKVQPGTFVIMPETSWITGFLVIHLYGVGQHCEVWRVQIWPGRDPLRSGVNQPDTRTRAWIENKIHECKEVLYID